MSNKFDSFKFHFDQVSKTPIKQRSDNQQNFGERLTQQRLECKKYDGRTTEEIELEK